MRLFWRKGYEATSLADLLEATGLSKSSLYATFTNKRGLFLVAFDAYRRARAKDMLRIFSGASAREALEEFFRLIVSNARTANGEGCMSINQAVELAPHDDDVAKRVRGDLLGMEKAFIGMIERSKREGSVTTVMPSEICASVLMLAFPGLQVMVRAGCDASMVEARVTALLSILD